MSQSVNDSLTGHFMVALPGLKTEIFQEAVIFICHHDASGAMGLVINQPINGLDLSDIMHNPIGQYDEDSDSEIFWGGPVNMEQGFVLHSSEVSGSSTLSVNADLSVTPHLDMLDASDNHSPAPHFYKAILGHVAWKSGELEKEWAENEWIAIPYRKEFIFDADPVHQWQDILADCGIFSSRLSPHQGRL
jgi:putative transcriptional regulator